MARSGATASAVVLLLVMMALVQGSMAAKHVVGGPKGWQMTDPHDPNFYQEWVHSNAPYFTVDSLEFQWIATDSVLQVDFAAFTACNTQNPIQAWQADPNGVITSMVFPLQNYAFHTLYFISGDVRSCVTGEKFFIDVLQ